MEWNGKSNKKNRKPYFLVAIRWWASHVKGSFFIDHGHHGFSSVIIRLLSIAQIIQLDIGERFPGTGSSTTTGPFANGNGSHLGCAADIIVPSTKFVGLRHIRINLNDVQISNLKITVRDIDAHLENGLTDDTQRSSSEVRQLHSFHRNNRLNTYIEFLSSFSPQSQIDLKKWKRKCLFLLN